MRDERKVENRKKTNKEERKEGRKRMEEKRGISGNK
jgi:hypothetical protein